MFGVVSVFSRHCVICLLMDTLSHITPKEHSSALSAKLSLSDKKENTPSFDCTVLCIIAFKILFQKIKRYMQLLSYGSLPAAIAPTSGSRVRVQG